MIRFNGETNFLEKYASPLVSIAIIVSIVFYILLINCFVPGSEGFIK